MSDKQFNLDELIHNLKQKENSTSSGARADERIALDDLDPERLAHLHVLCQSKAEEFALIGYDKINKDEIWRYFAHKYRNEYPPLHRMVNEILSLKITTFMNWETINAYKGI